ncbi:MAG: tRNA pseudouridine(55) synthase TruB [Lachnospiraceae bacterium]|nr:tRNA pseudouridine(55) synthase TruB [Lachnospiraceae bacterium]
MYDGLINIYKEKGFTSHDVVARLRGILRQKKIGHTGTLDPMAEGVLPVLLGKGTRLAELFSDHDKSYRAEAVFGIETDTEDLTGTILKEDFEQAVLSADGGKAFFDKFEGKIRDAAESFKGIYMQVPPMYSAKKVGGKKLYDIARSGGTVERSPAKVEIYDLKILNERFSEVSIVEDGSIKRYLPVFELSVFCSKGTYIRTLCSDIGKKAGISACMGSLLRDKAGRFTLDKAYKLSEVEEAVKAGTEESMIMPLKDMLSGCGALIPDKEGVRLALNGNKLARERISFVKEAEETEKVMAGLYRVEKPDGSLLGLYRETGDYYRPYKMFI